MRVLMLAVCMLGLIALVLAEVDYSGYQVLTVTPRKKPHLDILKSLQHDYGVDLWNEARALNQPVMMNLKPEYVNVVKHALNQSNVEYFVAFEDLQSVIMAEKAQNAPSNVSSATHFNFGKYNTYTDIVSFLGSITAQYPKISRTISIGKTYENRPIYAVQISSGGFDKKPVIMMECGVHAREWTSVAAGVYIINKLITGYGSDPTVTRLVDKYEFIMVPESNPDGYIFSWTENRLWRKTRSRSSLDWLGVCRGADANRNFDIDHCGVGTSRKPCDEIYCGDSPFSESEARALRDVMINVGSRMKIYFSIHAFSQLWMTPFGTTKKLPPNYAEMVRVATKGRDALSLKYGTQFKVGSISNIIYEAAGSSVDYAYVKRKIKYSYALELRDTGRFGFFLPNNLILPACEETFDGLMAAVSAV